ncbi:MAG: GNAT family acetyltransferase [Sphingomonas sp.]|uniref:GNAT family acetyltransferase n=1 Tax=Sphingomonas sp. TaxID=28214 RepID=UPI003565818A
MEAAHLPDAAMIIALWETCRLTRPWNDPRADFDRALTAPTSTVLVVRDAGAIIASIMVGDDGHRGWVYYLAVDPERRRIGLGRAMMAAAETWLRERGAPKLQLMVREGNAEAVTFYARLGLEPQPVVTMGKFLKG